MKTVLGRTFAKKSTVKKSLPVKSEEGESEADEITSANNSKEELIRLLNKMLEYLEPISYSDFNKFFKAEYPKDLRALEKAHSELGLARSNHKKKVWDGVSTLSIVATITDVLVGKRLGVMLDEEGRVLGFKFIE